MSLPPRARLVAYLRDSGGTEQDLSLEQQEAAIREWCDQRGHQLTAIFRDEAVSGGSTVGRAAFEAMLQHLRSPDCTDHGLVLWRFNRFARDFDDAQFYKADLRRRGYSIHSLNDSIPEGADGRLFEAAIDWMSQRFREDLSADIRRGLHFVAREYGILPGHRAPIGFRRELVNVGQRRDGSQHTGYRPVIDPNTAPLVAEAFRMRAAGATIKSIHKKLQLHTSRNGYSKMFRRQLYIGHLVIGKGANQTIVENYCDPIVDQATWDAVQAISHLASDRVKNRTHPRILGSSLILSGLVFCLDCQTSMVGSRSRNRHDHSQGYSYYRCQANKNRVAGPGCRMIRADLLEQAVLSTLVDEILAPANLSEITARVGQKLAAGKDEHHLNRLRKDLQTTKNRLANLVKAIAELGHSTAMLDEVRQLETHLPQLQEQIRQEKGRLQSADGLAQINIPALSQELKSKLLANPQQNKHIIRNLVHQVAVSRSRDGIIARIKYVWPIDVSIGNSSREVEGPAL
ncbi:MAG: recombinase family protein [Anaerolineales bacterium]|nr:recombinase family protein [Anaerolineales bacterium]MCW5855323.1 recombinase family protein [Anaerolineales bacterium]